MNTVNKPFRKKDAMQLVTGQPVYMDDVIPQDCLIVKLLRSPHANAMVRTINTTVAKKMDCQSLTTPNMHTAFTVTICESPSYGVRSMPSMHPGNPTHLKNTLGWTKAYKLST